MDNKENMQTGTDANEANGGAQSQQANGTQYNGQTQYNQQFNQTGYNQTGYNQTQFQQPQYQAPMYQPPIEDTTPLSVGQWMLTTLVLYLPCIGLIMAFVWAFGDGNRNRKNFCRSWLIWEAIGVGIVIILILIIAAAGLSFAELVNEAYNSSYYY